jgi:N-acetylneuraminic acid mutarotase
MPTARHHHTSVVLNGTLYVIGGRETRVSSNLDSNERYDPDTNTWNTLSPMPTKRSGLAASAINNDIFVVGGEKIEGSYSTNERYDPETDSWTSELPMPTARLGHDAADFDNKIYVLGGKTSQSTRSIIDANEILYSRK